MPRIIHERCHLADRGSAPPPRARRVKSDPSTPAGDSDIGIRILEIGQACLFKRVWPDSVTWVCPGGRPARAAIPIRVPFFEGEDAIPRLERELAEHRYDLIVYLAPGVPDARATRWDLLKWNFLSTRRANPERDTVWRLIDSAVATPLAVLDVHDAPQLDPGNLPLLDRCHAFFKRELPSKGSTLFFRLTDRRRSRAGVPAKLHPMSVGVSPERLAAAPPAPLEKTSDVFFAGTIGDTAVRRKGLGELLALRDMGISVDVGEHLPLAQYMERCARAWLVWSPEGLGKECCRHYEAPLCGSVPVINRADRIFHRPLREDVHCFRYDADKGGELRDTVVRALSNRARLQSMSREGRDYVLRHHTFEALSRYVASTTLDAARARSNEDEGEQRPEAMGVGNRLPGAESSG